MIPTFGGEFAFVLELVIAFVLELVIVSFRG